MPMAGRTRRAFSGARRSGGSPRGRRLGCRLAALHGQAGLHGPLDVAHGHGPGGVLVAARNGSHQVAVVPQDFRASVAKRAAMAATVLSSTSRAA